MSHWSTSLQRSRVSVDKCWKHKKLMDSMFTRKSPHFHDDYDNSRGHLILTFFTALCKKFHSLKKNI